MASSSQNSSDVYSLATEYLVEALPHAALTLEWQRLSNGVASITQAVSLPGNAVVRRLDVEVQAGRASWSALSAVGQVRITDSKTGTQKVVVVDFGTPRTVNAVAVVAAPPGQGTTGPGITIHEVRSWTGMKFDASPLYVAPSVGGAPDTTVAVATFSAEVRTERLQIVVNVSGAGTLTEKAVGERLGARLPSMPADLELRIDGGPPVWTAPGPVQERPNEWTTGSSGMLKRTVDLSAAFEALTGDPDHPQARTFQLELTARQPGKLQLTVQAPQLDYLARTELGADGKELTFEAEGYQDVPLTLPADARIVKEVRVSVSGALPPERALPPYGPDLASQAELELDAQRSACVRLPTHVEDTESLEEVTLTEVTGVRLPLRAMEGGAEVRVALLSNLGEDLGTTGGEPGPPLEGASASTPVVLEAPASGDTTEGWTLFEFPRPVPIRGAMPWAVVLVGRGTVRWTLGQYTSSTALRAVRRGPPAGPWVSLPSALGTTVGGRIHVIGHTRRDDPLAPVRLQPCRQGASMPLAVPPKKVMTTAREALAVWPEAEGPTLDIAGTAASLRVTSLTAGTLVLRNLMVVFSK
jgi:hypothetical protein